MSVWRRRSRLTLIVAAVFVLILYRVLLYSDWDPSRYAALRPDINIHSDGTPPEKPDEDEDEQNPAPPGQVPDDLAQLKDGEKGPDGNGLGGDLGPPVKPNGDQGQSGGDNNMEDEEDNFEDRLLVVVETHAIQHDPEATDAPAKIPAPDDVKISPGQIVDADVDAGFDADLPVASYAIDDDVHPQDPPGRLPDEVADAIKQKAPSQSHVHWRRQAENFPVPEESIIPLPTDAPKTFPKIQYDFAPETADAKAKREERLAAVKAAASRSWNGYRKYAWKHDELVPVSQRSRDPFCGWAATLVDSMDSLWIMGLTDEFDEAARAVETIDFTYTSRGQIPVFETVIRYLGGLLAAYDVSGGPDGAYPVLLDKAVELAEILMGVFDTPNRMPVLYYNWKPNYASQPHRATTAGLAELASLSMEFTRLAQITGKDKYYDAIARITDALGDLKDGGTMIPGLFPDNLNLSGCNKTATRELIRSKEAQAQAAAGLDASQKNPQGHVPDGTDAGKDENWGESPPRANVMAPEQAHHPIQRRAVRQEEDGSVDAEVDMEVETEVEAELYDNQEGPAGQSFGPTSPEGPLGADGKKTSFECVKQGIVPTYPYQTYGLGGGMDSAYEYFPKEDLVVGGLVPAYKSLHVDAVEAIKKWLLYRPMIDDDDRDILFTSKLRTSGEPETDAQREYEVTHLTCFVGGMFGLGGKMYDRPEDVELAKQLTDGCVWAYEKMPSGIMPEGSHVVPCPSLERCEFDQTAWWRALDPKKKTREKNVGEWEARQRKNGKNKGVEKDAAGQFEGSEADAALRKAAQLDEEERRQAEAGEERAQGPGVKVTEDGQTVYPGTSEIEPLDVEEYREHGVDGDASPGSTKAEEAEDEPAVPETQEEGGSGRSPDPNGAGLRLAKRAPPPDARRGTVPGTETVDDLKSRSSGSKHPSQKPLEDGGPSEGSSSSAADTEKDDEPRPLTHEEYVKDKIESELLPPGFVSIHQKEYILRPEAIESVWYMYRITGDESWQDKGWRMFEAITAATRTEVANSAVKDVRESVPAFDDKMESFWIAETLKYFYLLFSEPGVVSLDEWVLNTEAHPFRRPGVNAGGGGGGGEAQSKVGGEGEDSWRGQTDEKAAEIADVEEVKDDERWSDDGDEKRAP